MVDVTKGNFEELLPQILSEIESSSFVAIDTEFTGLLADVAFKGNLFDDGLQRYQKLCSNLRRFSICQLGLAVFKGVPDHNAYTVVSYNFYLRPHSCASWDPIIMCQTSSLEFLKQFQFDFNKWIYEGVACMNTDEMQDLRKELKSFFSGKMAINMTFEIENQLLNLGTWAAEAEEGDTYTVSPSPPDTHYQAMLLAALHNSFTGLWATLHNGEIVLKKVSSSEKKRLEAEDPERNDLVESLIVKNMGFTRIFHHLVALRKPLVLHNCLLDLILMYKQFHESLPTSYEAFKSNLHMLLPMIYDTKFVAEELKFRYREDAVVGRLFKKTGLGELAAALKSDLPVIYIPKLHHLPDANRYAGGNLLLHEAGYDAFLTGMCFLRMSHLCAMVKMPMLQHHRPLSPQEHLYALKQYSNRVHLARSAVHYMVLSGQDPRSKRPPWLLVEGQGKEVKVTPSLVSTVLARYGQLDVRPHNNNSVLVATSSWKSVTEILSSISSQTPLKAQIYRGLRHSALLKSFLWSSALVSTGLSAWVIYKSFKKSSP